MARTPVDGNPIVTDLYTSDPAVLVHGGTVHLYTGHDEAAPGDDAYVMRDWHGFSSTDLRTWTPHGPLLHVDDFAWARDGAKAGSVVERGGRFFWYVAVNHATIDGGAIGVAVADSPTGPFRDALGEALVTTTCRSTPATTTRSTRPSSSTAAGRSSSGARAGASPRLWTTA